MRVILNRNGVHSAILHAMSRARYWCFTLNNPTEEETSSLNELGSRITEDPDSYEITYLLFAEETGATGTRHYQGYLELSRRLRLNQVKGLPGLSRAHFERRRGTAQQAIDYCLKDNPDLVGFGSPSSSSQGTRTDLESLKEVQTDLYLESLQYLN